MTLSSDRRTELQGVKELGQGLVPCLLTPCPVLPTVPLLFSWLVPIARTGVTLPFRCGKNGQTLCQVWSPGSLQAHASVTRACKSLIRDGLYSLLGIPQSRRSSSHLAGHPLNSCSRQRDKKQSPRELTGFQTSKIAPGPDTLTAETPK